MAKKVTLAVSGKYHAFYLASELAKIDRLSALYSVHRTITPPKNVSRKQYYNRLDLALSFQLSSFIPFFKMTQLKRDRIFEKWISEKIKNVEPGILHSWTGNSHIPFSALKSSDWLKCLERSCPHNMFQYEFIRAEADCLNIEYFRDQESLKSDIEELYLSDIIVVPSQYSANSYSDPELIRKVRVNPLGANLNYRARVDKKPGLVVLMVGNNFLRKGTHYLIEAFKLIDRSDAELWIRGDVPNSYRHGITDTRVKIIPSVLPNKLLEIYQAADVFVLPSIDDGFGMAALEALALGLPVVITENVGAKDLLNAQVSITVPIRSPEALAIAILQSLEMPCQAFDEARRLLIENASWSNCANRMIEEVYTR